MATIITQPLIVAKVGLQSRPPPARNGIPFKSFGEVMAYIIEHEGPLSLFKGIGPQVTKGLFVQGLLMMTKERYVLRMYPEHKLTIPRIEVLFVLLFAYMKRLRTEKLAKAVETAARATKQVLPIITK